MARIDQIPDVPLDLLTALPTPPAAPAAAAADTRSLRAYCLDLGCSENQLDGSLIRHYLAANDWEPAGDPEAADLIIVNSCGFTEEAENRSLDAYREMLARKQPGARIIFAGCLPAMNRARIAQAGYQDVLVTPRTLSVLDTVTNARVPIAGSEPEGCIPFSSDGIHAELEAGLGTVQVLLKRLATALLAVPFLPVPRWLWQFRYLPDRDVELIRISVGCLNRCSFCSIPMAKGVMRSVAPDTVVNSVRDALRRGKRHISLSCDELGSYGQDIGTDIVALLDRVTALPGDFHVILRNAHPEWILKYWEGLAPILRRGRVSFLIIPVQSGSDRVLAMMRRSHTTAEYRRLVERIRQTAPAVIVRTHFIVGLPGETEDDYRATRRFAATLPVDTFRVHTYSDRPRTMASRMPGKVPADVIRRRARGMRWTEAGAFFRAFRWLPLRP